MAMQFVAVKVEDVIGLRLEIRQCVLLDGFKARGELFEALGGFRGAVRGGFGAFCLALQQFARGLRLTLGFFGMLVRGRTQIRDVIVRIPGGRPTSKALARSVTVAEATSCADARPASTAACQRCCAASTSPPRSVRHFSSAAASAASLFAASRLQPAVRLSRFVLRICSRCAAPLRSIFCNASDCSAICWSACRMRIVDAQSFLRPAGKLR